MFAVNSAGDGLLLGVWWRWFGGGGVDRVELVFERWGPGEICMNKQDKPRVVVTIHTRSFVVSISLSISRAHAHTRDHTAVAVARGVTRARRA